jgi:regulatory protein
MSPQIRLNSSWGDCDDKKFAALWVENRSEFRPRGRRALQVELRQKGIQDQTIENTLEDLDEEALAYRAAAKKARRYTELEYQDFRKKLSGFLARRGFNYGIISNIVPKIWDEISTNKSSENETESSEVWK